jgi:Spy/CpxP family protein refolding chaperone
VTRKLTTLFAAAAVLGGVAAATTVFGNETAPTPQPPRTEGATGGMMGQVSPDHMKQMTRMVDNCNRMMESVGNAPTGPEKERAPATRG